MPAEIDLLRSLDDEPRTPSTVDVRRAIADGRRRRAHRSIGYAGAATLTVVAVAGASVAANGLVHHPRPDAGGTPAASAKAKPKAKPKYTIPGTAGWKAPAATAPTSCALDLLPVPDGEPMALASGADPAGRYIVGRTYPKGGGYQAVIWHDGAVTKVMLPGDMEESLQDVNSAGTAVGWSYQGTTDEDTGPVPYVYRNGKVSRLPGVQRGEASAINDAGAIVGEESGGGPASRRAAVVWPSATAKPIRLPLPAGTTGASASDIDEDGTVVGNLSLDRPYVWFADGTHRELPLPTIGTEPAAGARVFTIRNGWATGVADAAGEGTGAGKPWPVLWNVRTGEVRLSSQLEIRASTANAQGWQVGTDKKGRAVLITETATVVLPDLARHEPGGLTNIPNTLSDDGRTIAGQSDDKTDTIQAVVWRCH